MDYRLLIQEDKMDAKLKYMELKQSFKPELDGQTASIKEAARLYQLQPSTIYGWIKKGLVTVIEPPKRRGMPSSISLREVAIMAELNRLHRQETNSRGPLKGFYIS
jgi:transposase